MSGTQEHEETTEEEGGDPNESELLRSLRQQLKDKDKLIDQYQPLARDEALRAAGFKPGADPNAKMLADVMALRKLPYTRESVEQLANEYGIAPAPGGGADDDGGPDPEKVAAARQRANASTAADDVVENSGSPDHLTEDERMNQQIDATYEAGDRDSLLTNIALQRKKAGFTN